VTPATGSKAASPIDGEGWPRNLVEIRMYASRHRPRKLLVRRAMRNVYGPQGVG
jgi:hypothetical protein